MDPAGRASAMPTWRPKAARQAQITWKRTMLKTQSVLALFFLLKAFVCVALAGWLAGWPGGRPARCPASPASAMPIWRPKAGRQVQITCRRKMLKTLSVLALFLKAFVFVAFGLQLWNNRIGERYAYMGAEGCSASARALQGVRFHWPHTISVYFVLSPKF